MLKCDKGDISVHGSIPLITAELMTLGAAIRGTIVDGINNPEPLLQYLAEEFTSALTVDLEDNIKRMMEDAEELDEIAKRIDEITEGNNE